MEALKTEPLRRLQHVLTGMLKQFDQVCRAHDIPYFIMWGTALGAQRHKGFIPWDDDLDVGMLRSDYERLRQVPAAEWNGLTLEDGGTDCFYHDKIFPRLYRSGTILETETWLRYTYVEGQPRTPVWLDIFLYDRVDSPEQAKKMAKKAMRLHYEYYYSKYRTHVVADDPLAGRLKSVAKNALHAVLSFRKPADYWRRYSRMVSGGSGKYIVCYDSWLMRDIEASFSEYADYYPPAEADFEGLKLLGPKDMHKHLSKTYGDYMQLPPESERVAHIPCNFVEKEG